MTPEDLGPGLVDRPSPRRLRRLGGEHELAGSWYDRASPLPLVGEL